VLVLRTGPAVGDDYVTFQQVRSELGLREDNLQQLISDGVIRPVRHQGTAKLTKREYKYLKSLRNPANPMRFSRNKRRPIPARKILVWVTIALWLLAPVVFFVGEDISSYKSTPAPGGLRGMANRASAQGSAETQIVAKNIATGVLVVAGLVVFIVALCLPLEK
jgi:hypothetical protein